MRILYNFATRSRPQKFIEAVNSINDNALHKDYVILVKVDRDDKTMWNIPDLPYVIYMEGESKNKIHAINRDIIGGWDILVNMSDDMRFTKKGFDLELIEQFDTLDLFLHYPDGYVNERLTTMSIMGREYFNRFGYVYHPDYVSLWCDNEAHEQAIELGKYRYVNEKIFIHDHPAWTGATPDQQLIETQKYYRQDERTYKKRKACGFPKHSVYS